MSGPTVSIVIPAFNEERRLGHLLETLRAQAPGEIEAAGPSLLETVIVDDGSTDDTARLLIAAAREDLRLRPLIHRAGNEGKGAAVAAGIAAARGDLVLIVDVDVATPFSEFRKLYERIAGGAGIAIGSRDLPGSHVVGAPRSRVFVGRAFNAMVRRLTGLPFRDTQCGFKLLSTSVARALTREQLVPGFAFDVELLLRARARGLVIEEVPIRYHHGSDSKVSPIRAAPRMAADLVRLATRLRVASAGEPSDPTTDDRDRDAGGEPNAPPDQPRLESHRHR